MTTTHESSMPVFDTRKYVRKLTRDGGVGARQADAHAGALHEALGDVATKADIAILRADMDALRVEVASVVREMQALRQFVMMGLMAGFGWMTLIMGLMTIAFKFF